MKKMVVGGWCRVLGALCLVLGAGCLVPWAAVAEPSVEITKVKLADARDGTVEYAYNVSGDLEGWNYDLVVKVTSGDGEASAVLTNEFVTAGAVTTNVNVKALLGKAYPGVSLFAKLERHLGGVQLWAGGPYFAQCNVGASAPEEYGYYFWWGDTVGYKRNASNNGWVSADGKSTTIEFSKNDGTANQTCDHETTWLANHGWTDESGNLVVSDDASNRDAARAHLGYPWRMMTDAELQKLKNTDYCTTEWAMQNGVYGCKVTGNTPGYMDKSIFLPAAGYGSSSSLNADGSNGYYWSSTPNSDHPFDAWRLFFIADGFGRSSYGRYSGYPVRPVRGSAE